MIFRCEATVKPITAEKQCYHIAIEYYEEKMKMPNQSTDSTGGSTDSACRLGKWS